jgi:predicted nucleotidyltransferase
MHRMNDKLKGPLLELRGGLEATYGPRLRGLYVFGSYARGDEDPESDLDIIVVLDRADAYGEEISKTSALVSDVALTHRLSISRVFVSERDWLEGDTVFLANAREEAIAA